MKKLEIYAGPYWQARRTKRLSEIKPGGAFRFPGSAPQNVYLMTDAGAYVNVRTGATYWPTEQGRSAMKRMVVPVSGEVDTD